MRTTIDLPDKLFRRLKAYSANQGISLKKFITRALERELVSGEKNPSETFITFPLVPSKKPGKTRLTSEKIAKILENEDSDFSSGH